MIRGPNSPYEAYPLGGKIEGDVDAVPGEPAELLAALAKAKDDNAAVERRGPDGVENGGGPGIELKRTRFKLLVPEANGVVLTHRGGLNAKGLAALPQDGRTHVVQIRKGDPDNRFSCACCLLREAVFCCSALDARSSVACSCQGSKGLRFLPGFQSCMLRSLRRRFVFWMFRKQAIGERINSLKK